MANRPDLYIPLIYLLVAIPYAWLGLHAWHRRPAKAVTPFAWTMLSISFWTLAYSLELFLPRLAQKLFVASIEYVGVVSTPIFLWFFALEFTGRAHFLSPHARRLFWGIPILTLILVWTNPFHQFMWDMETVIELRGLRLLEVRYGLFFWVHVFYSYGLLLTACILLLMEFIQRPGIYRAQISFIILGIILPFIGSGIYVSGNSPIPNLDITPLFFLPTALGLFLAINRYRMLDILPPEHITVLKNMRDGVIVLDAQQRVLYINPIAEALFNRSEDKVIGQPLAHISGTPAAQLLPFLTGKEHQAEIGIGDGNQARTFEVRVSPIVAQDRRREQPDLIIILRDITDRKETEKLLSRRESIMSAISAAAAQFLKDSSWEYNIPAVLERLGKAADVSRVYVVMNYTDEKGGMYSSLCYEWAAPSIDANINNPAMRHVHLRQAGFSRWEQTLSHGHPVHGLVQDLPPQEQTFLRSLGSLSIAAMPIFVDKQWWGFIMFDECRVERVWTSLELDAFRTIASIFGASESRSRAEQQLLRRQRSQNLLQGIVRDALKADTLKDMAQNAVERLTELIHAHGCFLTVWDENQGKTTPLAASGNYELSYPSLQPPAGKKTLTESALTLGHTLIVADALDSPYVDREVAENFPSRSLLALPLLAGESKLGALIIAFDTFHQFQADEISICEQAASLIALAMEKFQVMEDARRRANTSEILRKASLAIAEKLEMDHAVSHILDQLRQVVPYDSASVQLLEGNELVIIGGRGWKNLQDVVGMRFPVPSDNPNTVVIESGKPYHLPEAWTVYKAFREPPHDHIRSWLGVPLIAQDKVIGLLAIDSSNPNRFKEQDVHAAAEFANQVAVALENARIFEETQVQAITDVLTGVYNRRGLFQVGEFEFRRARRILRPFSAMIFDIDHFKRINDHHGHAIGDQVLQKLAERCRQNSRAIDLMGRYGGEEFVILLPETNIEAAKAIAERQRKSIMDAPFQTDVGALRITISIGVAEAGRKDTLNTLIEKADTALYKAKSAGRNRVCLHEAG